MRDIDESWTEYQNIIAKEYSGLNYKRSLQSYAMNVSHRLIEKPYEKNKKFKRVLEIGAGPGTHFPFVKHDFDEYVLTDSREESLKIAEKILSEKHAKLLSYDVQDGGDLTYESNSFDRIIAAHVLEHINDPHLVLREWYRVLRYDGVLSIVIPTDPGIAWRLGKCLGPRKSAKMLGISYDYTQAREHVNSCINLVHILQHLFPNSVQSWWPLKFPSVDANLFFSFHATKQKS